MQEALILSQFQVAEAMLENDEKQWVIVFMVMVLIVSQALSKFIDNN